MKSSPAFLFLLVSIYSPHWCNGNNCSVESGSKGARIVCNAGNTGGEALDEALSALVSNASGVRTPIGHELKIIAHANVTIRENGLAIMPKLEILLIQASPGVGDVHLEIPGNEFANTPKLRVLNVDGMTFAASTIVAMDKVKDQLQNLALLNCKPAHVILTEVTRFSNLRKATFYHMSGQQPFPTGVLSQSADKLQEIDIISTYTPKLQKGQFDLMKQVVGLYWQHSNITEIEPGAFDDLVKLEILDLSRNKIRRLPPGLFAKTTNLRKVTLSGNGVENLSRENFTQCCPKFETLLT